MNNIGLIISGNLTGFSRFYASPNANDIYNEAKFDFDYRNFLTFLSNDDKAYAISFAPTVISVSLVTRILDSFRRPGVLVVSILLPRNKKVESAMNAQNNKALYQLLNAVHDTFREKNFVNGMVNQNAAVLMQDYYTDILSNFVLVPDGLQRPINSRIDVSSPNKRLGYVKSTEDNVPLYLSSLCRKSYESYHHVFIAENAPQNIDEEPVEVVFYSVKIINNGQRIQNVKLTDKIYNLQPEEGEIDIDKNYTYQQVVNGEAGRNIVASFVGDTIEITYRFAQEKRNIQFSFVDGGAVVPFASISPRVTLSNGEKFNIGNENWTFEGKEIYDRKTIESGNSNYIIKRESVNLDIRRLKDGSTCLIQVERCSPIEIAFRAPYNKPKKISFRRANNTPIVFEATDYLREILPGRLEEYTYTIDSNHYERATGKLQPLGVPSVINLRIKENSQTTGNSVKRVGETGQTDVTPHKVGTSVRGVNNNGTLVLDGEGSKPNTNTKPKKDNKKKYALFGGASAIIGAVILCLVFFGGDLKKKFTDGDSTPGVVAENDSVNRDIIVTFLDKDNDPIESKYIDFSTFSELVKIVLTPDEFIKEADKKTDGIFELKYNVEGQASEIKNIEFTISLGGVEISDGLEKESFEALELLSDSEEEFKKEIKLSLRTSEILLYKDLLGKVGQKITTKQKNEYLQKIEKVDCKDNHNSDIVNQMLITLNGLEIDDPKPEPKPEPKPKPTTPSTPKSPTTQEGLDAQLPPDIRGTISTGSNISNDRVEKYQGEQKKALLDYKWLRYDKHKKNIPNDVKRKLAGCKTFRELQDVARNN